jgi:hypothetical protein
VKNRKDKNLRTIKSPESPSKRDFIKKTISGIVLLPYMVPIIESFNIIAESAETGPTSGGRGVGAGVARGVARGRARGVARGRITPPPGRGRGSGQNNGKKQEEQK